MTAHARTLHLIEFEGELDIAATALVRSRLTACDPDGDLLIDLAQVTFLDSSSLGELIAAHRRHTARSSRIVLVGAGRAVRRVLTITGLDAVIPQAATVALAHQLLETPAPTVGPSPRTPGADDAPAPSRSSRSGAGAGDPDA